MGREKTRGRRKKARAGRLGPGLKHKLGAIHPGVELSAKIYDAELGARVVGAELPSMSPPCGSRAQELGARDAGAETC